MLAVVLGHNSVLIGRYPNVWFVIYAFNIFPFLFLPFLFPARPLTWRYAADRVVRYLVPWALTYLLCCCLFFLQSPTLPWTTWLAQVGAGLVIGTAPLVKAASGFQLFWFLPCLLALVLLRAACARWPRAGALLIWGAGLFLLAIIGQLPQQAMPYVPATAYLALMMCPVGAALAWIWHGTRDRVPRGALAVLFGGAWLSLSVWIYRVPVSIEHSGFTVLEPAALIVRLGAMGSSFVFLCAAAEVLAKVPGLAALGRHSLLVYLTSSLWFQVWLRLERMLDLPAWYRESFALRFGASLAFSLAAAYLLSRAVTGFEPARRWVMPRSWAEWPPTARCRLPGESATESISNTMRVHERR